MFDRPLTLRRGMAMAALAAALLALGACESSRIPLLRQEAPQAQRQKEGAPPARLEGRPLPRVATRPPIRRPLPPTTGETPEKQRPGVRLTPPADIAYGVRVGLLLPLSGPNAKLGRSMLEAGQLALFDFAGEEFEMVVHDTQGTPDGARVAAQRAVAEGAELILGPLLSGSVKAAAPEAAAVGVNMLAFSNDPAAAGDGVYLLGFHPSEEVMRVVTYAMSRGLDRFAVLAPDNAYGHAVAEAVRDAAYAHGGGEVTEVVLYDPYTDDFHPIIKRLAHYEERRAALLHERGTLKARKDEVAKRALARLENRETLGDVPYNALMVAAGGETLQRIAALLPFYDIDPDKVRMLGTGQWDVAGVGAEPALQGGWFAAPAPQARARFVERFRQAYGHPPARLATLAYDAVAMAAVLARAEDGNGYSEAALTQPSGFDGRDGIFRLLSDGLNQRGLAIIQVGHPDNKVIDPAPQAFEER